MDIESADKKFNLKLDELLNTRIFDFAHDYCGIRNNINRNEFPATDFGLFAPRFASEKEKKMEFHVNLDFNMKMRPGEAEEEKYMNKYYLRQPTKRTAKVLNRSIESVRKKAVQMGINTYYDGYLSAHVLAECFSTNTQVIKRWIEKFNLPAIKINDSKHRTRYQIDPENFWKWADGHRDVINWSGYDLCSILPEPQWVEFEQSRYKTKRHCRKFTANEIVQIKHMLRKCMTYKEIAEKLGRTERSIEAKVRKIA